MTILIKTIPLIAFYRIHQSLKEMTALHMGKKWVKNGLVRMAIIASIKLSIENSIFLFKCSIMHKKESFIKCLLLP